MKSIYLDASHLINWLEAKCWSSKEVEAFEALASTGEFQFILSSIHLDEISDVRPENRPKVFETFRRILDFPHSWIIGPRDLHAREITTVLGLAITGDQFSQGAFQISEIIADSWGKVVQIDDPAWAGRFAQQPSEELMRDFILHRHAHETRALKETAQSDMALVKALGKRNRGRLLKALRIKDQKYIDNLMPNETAAGVLLPPMVRRRVIDQLCDNKSLPVAGGLGIFLNLRNEIMSNEQNPARGDTWDACQASFLPYCDLFSCDKRTENYLASIKKRLKQKWPARVHSVPIVSDVEDLLAEMRAMVGGGKAPAHPPAPRPAPAQPPRPGA